MFQLRHRKFAQTVLPVIAALGLLAPTLSSAADTQEIARNSILSIHSPGPVQTAPVAYDAQQAARDSILGKPVGSGSAVVQLAGVAGQVCHADTQEVARASILGIHAGMSC